jgi:hypothetical protein
MKKIFIALILIFIIFLLSGCGDSFKIPRVELIKNGWRFDNTYLPLRDNYKFAEIPYGIEETENGYNIIIYCVEEKENELQ